MMLRKCGCINMTKCNVSAASETDWGAVRQSLEGGYILSFKTFKHNRIQKTRLQIMLEEGKNKLEMKNSCITEEKEAQGRKHASEQGRHGEQSGQRPQGPHEVQLR